VVFPLLGNVRIRSKRGLKVSVGNISLDIFLLHRKRRHTDEKVLVDVREVKACS